MNTSDVLDKRITIMTVLWEGEEGEGVRRSIVQAMLLN